MLSMAVRQPAATHHIRNCSLSVIIICKQQWQSVASPCLFFQKKTWPLAHCVGLAVGLAAAAAAATVEVVAALVVAKVVGRRMK
jgi:hypothetical protein